LRLGLSYDGPTELGGLVVDPKYRRAPERLGLLISYVRFLFLAAHAEWFREQLLAELLPPLEPDGTSHLWEALGRCFTGLSYREADLLSSENKDFIVDLFPSGVIYSTLLSAEAQSVIGKVGAPTKGVEKLLRRVGFRYAHRIDPFDGGPHFVATRSEVAPIQMVRKVSYSEEPVPEGTAVRCLVARELTEPPYFRAIACSVKFAPDGRAVVEREGSEHLNLAAGENVWCLPLP
jgi:arginine N-succinyltransferase